MDDCAEAIINIYEEVVMDVIKVGLMIISFASTALCYSMDQSNLKRIPVEQLLQYEGEKVVYHKGNGNYEDVILGKRVLTSMYYEARLAKKPEHGIICLMDRLYVDNNMQKITV